MKNHERLAGGQLPRRGMEHAILVALAKNHGRTVLKDDLLEAVAEEPSGRRYSKNSLWKAIYFIRNLLAVPTPGVSIKNIRGVGYRFEGTAFDELAPDPLDQP